MPASPVSRLKPKIVEGPGQGIIRSVPPRNIPERAWANARNVRFDSLGQRVRKIDGYTQYDTTPGNEPVRWLFEYHQTNSDTILVRVGTTKAWRDAGTDRAEIASGLGGLATTIVTGTQHADQLLWTDQIAPIQRWTPDMGSASALSAGIPLAAIIVSHKAHLVLFDVVDRGIRQPFRATYSEPWDPQAGSPNFISAAAGDLDFLDEPGGITAAGLLGESIIVHKRRSLARMIFVGEPDNYVQEPIPAEDGACSRRAIVPVGAFQFYQGHENYYRLGAFPEPIGDAIWPEVVALMDQSKLSQVHAYHRPEFTEIHWKVPMVGATQPNLTVIYNYRDQTWTLSDHDPGLCAVEYPPAADDTWAGGESAAWDSSHDIPWDYPQFSQGALLGLFGQVNGNIQQYGGVNADGAAIAWYLESKVFSGATSFQLSDLLNVLVRATGQGTMLVRHRSWMDDRQPVPAFAAGAGFPLGSGTKPWVDVRGSGRWHQIRLEGSGLDEDFLLEAWGPGLIPRKGWR
jgi:hypothetical protein